MSNWKTYRIGNGLRGHHIFKARSLKEAWKAGCRHFNEAFGPGGRIVYLADQRAYIARLTERADKIESFLKDGA